MKWPEVEIRQIAQVVSGFGFPRKFQGNPNQEFPFFKVGDMNSPGNERCMNSVVNTISAFTLKKLKAKTFPPGTIIFPKIGAAIATNKKRMLTQPSVVDNNVMGLIPNSLIDEWYLYYWMQQFDLRSVTNIGPVPSMRKTEVERVRIPLPSLTEQRRIVEILDQADALRKKRAEADAKAARILPALFYKMFGDPATNPNGWPTKPLGELAEHLTSGSRGWSKYTGHGKALFLRTQDINDGEIATELLKVDPPSGAESKRTHLVAHDVVVTITGMVGKAAVFYGNSRPVYVSQHIALVRLKKNLLLPEYLVAYANLPHRDLPMLARFQYGQTKPGLGFRELRQARIQLPPLNLQEEFTKYVLELQRGRFARRKSLQALSDLWVSLLHRAFTGDLTATWREAHMKKLLAEMEQQVKALKLEEPVI